MADQWPRALLRAALIEAGYDAIGTRSLSGALAHPTREFGRGPVRALIVDAGMVEATAPGTGGADLLAALTRRHGDIPIVLLASAVRADPPGPWTRVMRRPFSVADVVGAVKGLGI